MKKTYKFETEIQAQKFMEEIRKDDTILGIYSMCPGFFNKKKVVLDLLQDGAKLHMQLSTKLIAVKHPERRYGLTQFS